MSDRFRALVGAGAVAAGVSVALIGGAGVATADAETSSGAGDSTSSAAPGASAGAQPTAESASGAESGSDTDTDDRDDSDDRDDAYDTDDADADLPAPDADDASEGLPADDDAGADPPAAEDEVAPDDEPRPPASGGPADGRDVDTSAETVAASETDAAAAPDATAGDDSGAETDTAADAGVSEATATSGAAAQLSAAVPTAAVVVTAEPSAARTVTATVSVGESAAQTATQTAAVPRRQTLLSLVGAVIFNLYSVAIRVLGGPSILPPNSTVTVRSSTLTIDCGDGYDVPADWYVPHGPTPTRLIYFQHGFMAAGPFYSYTAARLAEATHSIVVTTSLTSNFLACDGCWVGGSPMHKAVADLFVDGNSALADSALAAGYSSTLLDGVTQIGLTGHSAGGGLAAGAAGYMIGSSDNNSQNNGTGTGTKLAGVVMLDGVGFGDVTPDALAKLPLDFPIYNLAARSYYWNLSGVTNTALQAWRLDGFNGVKLTNSSHGDAMSGGNIFVQVAMNLVTGWPRPANVQAAEKISAGWFNDMFSGTRTSGVYGVPGESREIVTGRGVATAQILPGQPDRLTLLDWLFTFGARILFSVDFAVCAEDPEMNTPNSALSLDGRTKAGQSSGQQCMHG